MKKKLTCHCKAIEIEVNLQTGLEKLMRCNCSICKKKGTIMTAVDLRDLKIVKGEDKITTYKFHTKVAKHYFCSDCGVYTHHQRRSNPNTYGINVGCIDDIDPQELFKLKVAINDGHNHVMDKKKQS